MTMFLIGMIAGVPVGAVALGFGFWLGDKI
jgi:hypothetical protein